MIRFVKTPKFVETWFYDRVWKLPTTEKVIYLTFDDGPHPATTDFVLDTLALVDAKATFFCLGDQVAIYPDLMQRMIAEGHSIGNHSYSHLSGWKTDFDTYVNDVAKAGEIIPSNLYRPPYGKISKRQFKALKENYKIIMWDVMNYDFDEQISVDECISNVTDNIQNGSIVVLHENDKTKDKLKDYLPDLLRALRQSGYVMRGIQL